MSNELERLKHSRRRALTDRHIHRQVKIAKAAGHNVTEEHRYAKHNAMDCGITQCPVCHGYRVKRALTIQEIKSIEDAKEISYVSGNEELM